jgi:hypothetical protein
MALAAVMLASAAAAHLEKSRRLQSSPNHFHSKELGGYLNQKWHDYIELAKQTHGATTEEYWGLWSATNRTFPDWPVDSVIHALGEVRAQALAKLPDAETIITTRYAESKEWQPLNLSQNFWFYNELLNHWHPVYYSPTTVVWKKAAHANPSSTVNCIFRSNQFELQTNRTGFFSVTLDYTPPSAKRVLIRAQNNMSFGADSNGHVSLDPRAMVATFPVHVGDSAVFELKTSPAGYSTSITGCRARSIEFSDPEVLHTPEPPPQASE